MSVLCTDLCTQTFVKSIFIFRIYDIDIYGHEHMYGSEGSFGNIWSMDQTYENPRKYDIFLPLHSRLSICPSWLSFHYCRVSLLKKSTLDFSAGSFEDLFLLCRENKKKDKFPFKEKKKLYSCPRSLLCAQCNYFHRSLIHLF